MKKLTKKQKAKIAIAEDVIAQINAKRYVAESGVYIRGLDDLTGAKGELQEVVKKQVTKKNPCNVCALGSLFLSTVGKYDQFAINDKTVEYGDVRLEAMRKKLGQYFSEKEIAIIEASFEIDTDFIMPGYYPYPQSESGDARGLFVEFNESTLYKYVLGELDEEDRLLWIMGAVIAQGGKPTMSGFNAQLLFSAAFGKDKTSQYIRKLVLQAGRHNS